MIFLSSHNTQNSRGYNYKVNPDNDHSFAARFDPLQLALEQKKAALVVADNKAVETYVQEIEVYCSLSKAQQRNDTVNEDKGGVVGDGAAENTRKGNETTIHPVTGVFKCISGEQGCFVLVSDALGQVCPRSGSGSSSNKSYHKLYLLWDRWDIDCLVIGKDELGGAKCTDGSHTGSQTSAVAQAGSLLDMLHSMQKEIHTAEGDVPVPVLNQQELFASPALRFVKLATPSASGYTLDKKELTLTYDRAYAISGSSSSSSNCSSSSSSTNRSSDFVPTAESITGSADTIATITTTTTTTATAATAAAAAADADVGAGQQKVNPMLSLLHSKVRAVQSAYGIAETQQSCSGGSSSSSSSIGSTHSTAVLFDTLLLSAELLVLTGYMLFAPDIVEGSASAKASINNNFVPYLSTYSEEWASNNSYGSNNYSDSSMHGISFIDEETHNLSGLYAAQEMTSTWAEHKQKYTDDESGLEDGEEEEEEEREAEKHTTSGTKDKNHSKEVEEKEEERELLSLLPSAKRARFEDLVCSAQIQSDAIVGSRSGSNSNDTNLLPAAEHSSQQQQRKGPLSVCAIDCEMCLTSAGLELTRLTVVSLEAIELDLLVSGVRTSVLFGSIL